MRYRVFCARLNYSWLNTYLQGHHTDDQLEDGFRNGLLVDHDEFNRRGVDLLSSEKAHGSFKVMLFSYTKRVNDQNVPGAAHIHLSNKSLP
jgi:hypothetical protein